MKKSQTKYVVQKLKRNRQKRLVPQPWTSADLLDNMKQAEQEQSRLIDSGEPSDILIVSVSWYRRAS